MKRGRWKEEKGRREPLNHDVVEVGRAMHPYFPRPKGNILAYHSMKNLCHEIHPPPSPWRGIAGWILHTPFLPLCESALSPLSCTRDVSPPTGLHIKSIFFSYFQIHSDTQPPLRYATALTASHRRESGSDRAGPAVGVVCSRAEWAVKQRCSCSRCDLLAPLALSRKLT